MYVKEIKAEPNACGGQIDLSWKNPSKDEFPNFKGVKIVRRERRFPEASPPRFSSNINDFLYHGTLIYNGTEESFSDKELHGETVYYYTFYTYDDNADPTKVGHFTNRASRIAAMATSNYGMGDKLNEFIPAIYKRYDTIYAEPGTVAPEDEQKGELQRFMEILGGQLDLIGSFVAGTRKFLDLDQCDGSLLPLLGQWIGWQTNPSLDINSQRNEIRYAPELYKTVGIAANLRAFVNRLINWNCQVKEFCHNVFRTNAAPELAIWMQQKTTKGWQTAESFILDTAFEGAPAVLRASDDTIWLFYHAHRGKITDIWYKIYSDGKWQPANRLTDGRGLHRYPAAVQTSDSTIHLFWSALEKNVWHLKTAKYNGDSWSAPTTVFKSSFSDIEPTVFAEPHPSEAIWLFWSSLRKGRWHIWYSRFDGKIWFEPQQLTKGNVSDRKPAVALSYPILGTGKIWVFWSRKKENGWRLFYRTKPFYRTRPDLNFKKANWSKEAELPGANYDDTEPFAIVDRTGNLYLYWRSNRTGADNIWYRSYLRSRRTWQPEQQITFGADLCQGPTVLNLLKGKTLLWYRSTKSIEYISELYPETKTLDHRYAGATTVDMRNVERIKRRGQWEDNQAYTYDTGKDESNWYARDTIGLYLTPETEDQQLITRSQELVKGILNRFLPVQLRAVFIINPAVYPELVYTYDFPSIKPQRLIDEQFFDSNITEVYPGLSDSYKDKAPDWIWLHSWSEEYLDHHTVDFTTTPTDTKFRTWHIGLEPGGYNPWKS
jgi:phage tail-like protein